MWTAAKLLSSSNDVCELYQNIFIVGSKEALGESPPPLFSPIYFTSMQFSEEVIANNKLEPPFPLHYPYHKVTRLWLIVEHQISGGGIHNFP